MPSPTRFLVSLLLSLLLMGSAAAVEKVNINTADAATIDRVLLNIGPAKAKAIVDYRRANGEFKSIDQLAMVKGVGLKTIEKNRDRIEVSGSAGRGVRTSPNSARTVSPTFNR